MSNLKPAFSVIPHAPGLAQPIARPVATPGIAHAPGLVRPQEAKPPPVSHAPGIGPAPVHHEASKQAVQAVLALHSQAVPQHGPIPIDVPPHGSMHARTVPTSDFEAIKRRKIVGVPEIGLAPPGQGASQAQIERFMQQRQQTGLPVNNRSNTLQNVALAGLPARSIPVIQYNGTCDDTDLVTLTLGIQEHTPEPPGNAGFDSRIIADVMFGTGNASFRFQCDWGVGTSLSLLANFLAVNALIPDNTSVVAAPTYDLAAGVGYGAVPAKANRVRLTQQTTPATAQHSSNNTPYVRIPPFATSFSISVSQPTGGSFPLQFPGPIDMQLTDTASGANPVVFTNYRYSAATNLAWQESNTFPITNGARFIVFVNTDAANDAIIRVNFDLSF